MGIENKALVMKSSPIVHKSMVPLERLSILLNTQMNIAIGTFDSRLMLKLRMCKLLLASFHVANNTLELTGDVHW